MNEQLIGSSALLVEEEVQAEHLGTLQLAALTPQAVGNWHGFSVTVGPRSGDVVLKVTGVSFRTTYPNQVLCQARQNSNQNLDFGWSDQFSIQVIETSSDFVRIRVRRMDDGTGSSGWGQNLRVDFLVID